MTMTQRPASSQLHDQLTCSVCLERYLDPRTLPCHHSFCKVCLDKIPARSNSDQQQQETEKIGFLTIACPVCRKQVLLPPGGVSELPPAFLINNLLEVQKASSATYVNVQPQSQHRTESAIALLCGKHERALELYCSDCRVLLCSECFLKGHRAHDCDLASDVYKTHRKLVEDQLDLLRRDVTHVDSMLAYVDSVNDRLTSNGDETKKAIAAIAEQLHRHIEEEKVNLMTIVDQNIDEKKTFLKIHREKGSAIIAQMRKSESVVEGKLEKLKGSIEIMAVKDELVQIISEVRLNRESMKFTAPNMISFSSNSTSSSNEIGFLFEPVEKGATKEIVVGKECRYILYLPRAETNPVCHLVPSNKNLKPSDCQVSFIENANVAKYEVSFTPSRVGHHDLILFPDSLMKKTIVAQFLVNSPFLQENRRQISKQILSKPSAMAFCKSGDLVVCESASDRVVVLGSNDGNKLSSITSLSGSKKKSLNKPCSVGVTPDNCIIVIDSGKQCYRLLKIQMDGKLIAMTNLTNKDTLQFQSPNALAVHPSSGEIYIVDLDAHSIFLYNADLTFCRIFGGKGKACGFFNQPHSIAFDSVGNAYVSDSMNHRIQKFSTSEEGLLQVDVFGSGYGSELSHLTRPTALCISCYDTIFVTDEHKRIAAFDTQGRFLGEVRYSRISLTNPCAMVVGKNESHLSVLDSYVEALYIIL